MPSPVYPILITIAAVGGVAYVYETYFAERVESWVESVVARRREQRRRGKAVLARGHDTGSSSSSSGINIEGSGPSGWSGRSGDDSMMSVGRSSNLERSGSHAGWAQRGKENRPRSSDAAGQAELEQEMDLLRFEGGQDGAETSWAEVEGHGSLRKRPRGDQLDFSTSSSQSPSRVIFDYSAQSPAATGQSSTAASTSTFRSSSNTPPPHLPPASILSPSFLSASLQDSWAHIPSSSNTQMPSFTPPRSAAPSDMSSIASVSPWASPPASAFVPTSPPPMAAAQSLLSHDVLSLDSDAEELEIAESDAGWSEIGSDRPGSSLDARG